MSHRDDRRDQSDKRSRRHSSKDYSEDKGMSSRFNRVRVADLLNHEPASSSSHGKSKRDKASSSDSDSPGQFIDIECKIGHCKRKFPTKEALLAHQKRSHPMPTEFICEQCKSSFSTAPNLNKHVRSVHEKLKPFKCDQCTSTFAFRDGLERHRRMVHEQARPYPCDYCKLRFKTKAHLLKHSYKLHPHAYRTPRTSNGAGPSGQQK